MKVNKLILLSVLFFALIASINFVSADTFKIVNATPNYINRTTITTLNLTINHTGVTNISQLIINLPSGATYYANSNATNIRNGTFSNTSNQLIWTATSTKDFINTTNSTASFLFNISLFNAGSNTFTIFANDTENGSLGINTNTTFVIANFDFAGYVKNETSGNVTNASVEIYQYVPGTNGPPTEIYCGNASTMQDSSFIIRSINGSASLYKLKIYYRNENSSGNVTKTGTILPPFPAMLFYPQLGIGNIANVFMRPPTLNGTTFYIEPAAVLNITAINNTGGNIPFGYQVLEQKTGFPIASNIKASINSTEVIVPLNRRYTVMAVRDPQIFPFGASCAGNVMNMTSCPSPPKSNSTVIVDTAGVTVNVNLNLSVQQFNLYGCINVSGVSSLSQVNNTINITKIIPKLLPWTGFVPPMKAEIGSGVNVTNKTQLNYTVVLSPGNCSGTVAFYNITLMNADYLVEFYGVNSTGAEYVAAFQNVTISATTYLNITLLPLAGTNVTEGEVNTSKVLIQFVNSTGSAITTDTPHTEIYMRHSSFGELHYIVESMTNGAFYIPILSNATAKIKAYPNQGPPIEKNINLSASQNNITLITMTGGDSGFRKVNATTGALEQIDVASTLINMRFLKSGMGDCDGINPSSSCELTTMNATSFNPLLALVAGKINMEMSLAVSGVKLTFYNFDMFSAKQPPMNSIMNNGSSGGTSTSQLWQFGSFVPAGVYDYAVVTIPYSDSQINDSQEVRMSIPQLYDSDWNVVWNSTRGDTTGNLTSDIDEYLTSSNSRSYNDTGYRSFLIGSGVLCSSIDANVNGTTPNAYCYINTTANKIYMRVPHFSGVSPLVTGAALGTATGTSSTSTPGSTTTFWTSTQELTSEQFTRGYSKELAVKNRIKVLLNNTEHFIGLVSLTSTTATINISSTPQQVVFNIGDEKKFELTNDSYYDLSVKLNGIANNKANVTVKSIHELIVLPAANCGNGKIDSDENCANCPADVRCPAGSECKDNICINEAGEEVAPEGQETGIGKWIIIGIVIIVIIIAVILLVKSRSKKPKFR